MKSYTESEHNAAMDRLAADLSAKRAHAFADDSGFWWVRWDNGCLSAMPNETAAKQSAAAPDLAEALRGLLLDGHSGAGLGRVARDRARTALAKAGL